MKLKSSERRMKLILMLQQSNQRLTVAKLADKFNVSERTVYRDFNALSDLNVPVTWDKYQGYGVMRSYSVPPLMFTSKELAVIMIGLNFVKSQVDETLVEDAEGVELKIKEVLPDKLLDFMGSIGGRTVVDPYLNYGPDKKAGGNWYKISNAIAENKTIQFDYVRSSDNQTTIRKLNPYLIVFYGDHWNLIGYSHKRNEIRNFILEQVSNIEETGNTFAQKSIDVESLIFRSVEPSKKIMVEVEQSIFDRFQANLPAKIIGRTKKAKQTTIEFEFDNLDYINEWLMQFTNKIKVLSPQQLKEKRRELLKEMSTKLTV